MNPSREPERAARARLRYRRVGGGYRPEDVEQTLAGLRRTVRHLEVELEDFRARAAALEANLAATRAELEGYRRRSDDPAQAVAEALRQAAEIEETARRRARAIVAAAQGRKAGAGEAGPEPPAQAGQADAQPRAPEEWPPQIQVFERRVELDAGPFADADALADFERALARLPRVEDVYVRSLDDGRATIELLLDEPVRLVPILRERLPFQFEVRVATPTSLVLEVDNRSPRTGAR